MNRQGYSVNNIEFIKNDKGVIVGSDDGSLIVLDITNLANPKLVFKKQVFTSTSREIKPKDEEGEGDDVEDENRFTFKVSPVTDRVIVLSKGRCQLWELNTSSKPIILDKSGESVDINDACFSQDGLLIATTSSRIIRVWDADRGLLLKQIDAPSHNIEHVKFFPSTSEYIIFTSEYNQITKWTLSGNGFITKIWGAPKYIKTADEWPSNVRIGWGGNERSIDIVRAIASPDKKLLLTGNANGTIQIFNRNGELINTPHEYAIDCRDAPFAFSKSSKYILVQDLDDTLIVINALNGCRIGYFKPTERISYAALSPDGKRIAVALEGSSKGSSSINTDGSATFSNPTFNLNSNSNPNNVSQHQEHYTIDIVDIATKKVLSTLDGHLGRIRDLEFSKDGKKLVSCSEDSTARIWILDNKNESIVCKGHTGIIWHVAFSDDCNMITTASSDSTAVIWNSSTGKSLLKIRVDKSVTVSKLSNDCTKLITASGDKVQIWEAKSGKEKNRFIVHDEKFVKNAELLSDGKIMSIGDDGFLRIYPIEINYWYKKAMGLSKVVKNQLE